MKKFLFMAMLGCSLAANAAIKDVIVTVANADIYETVMVEAGTDTIGNLTVTVVGDVTATNTIPVFGDASILGGNSSATIDASALTGPMVATIDTTLAEWKTVNVKFQDLKITGLAQPMFQSGAKNYLYDSFTVSKCYVEVASDVTVFNFTKGGYPYNFSIDQSTFYAPAAIKSSFISTQGGQKATENPDTLKQTSTFSFTQSTLYNITYNKNFISHRQNGQTWLNYILKNCVVINCGKADFLASLNGGQGSTNPNYTVNNNSIGTLVDGVYTDLSASQNQNVIDSTTVFYTDSLVLADAANGEFYLADSTAQFKNNAGDPQWLYPSSYDLYVELPSGSDIGQALADSLTASGKSAFNNVEISLETGGTYTFSKGVSILNNFKMICADDPATIDASGLTETMISFVANNTGLWKDIDGVYLNGVNIKGLTQALVASTSKNYIIGYVTIRNSMIELAADVTTIDFTKGSIPETLILASSTVYAPTATKSSFISSQGGQKVSEYSSDITQRIRIYKNTLYNVTYNKNFISHRQSGQKWLDFYVKNNIIVNCGKANFLASLNGGQNSDNPNYTVGINTIGTLVDGTFTSLDDQQKEVSGAMYITEDPQFKDVANADFTIGSTTQENQYQIGDPRWLSEYTSYSFTPAYHTPEVTVAEGDSIFWETTLGPDMLIQKTKTADDGTSATKYAINDITYDWIYYNNPTATVDDGSPEVQTSNRYTDYNPTTGVTGSWLQVTGENGYVVSPVVSYPTWNKYISFFVTGAAKVRVFATGSASGSEADGNQLELVIINGTDSTVVTGTGGVYGKGKKSDTVSYILDPTLEYEIIARNTVKDIMITGINLWTTESLQANEDYITGITEVATEQKANNGAAYNLSGQAVGESYKGLIIRNGKKFIKK